MKKEDFLSSDFFKQFKTAQEFNEFFSSLHKRGLEAMLEGELDAHLGYEKHEKSTSTNARNGTVSKQSNPVWAKHKSKCPEIVIAALIL